MSDGRDRYTALVREIEAEFPRFKIVRKRDSPLHRAIDAVLRALTLGQMTRYLSGYQTTLGNRVYVTEDWDSRGPVERYLILRHERIHLRQFRRYTWPGMALLYLLLPLPMGLAWFRARLEKEAYAETVLATAAVYGLAAVKARGFEDRIVDQFTGPAYGWMWPFPASVRRWYRTVVDRAAAEIEVAW